MGIEQKMVDDLANASHAAHDKLDALVEFANTNMVLDPTGQDEFRTIVGDARDRLRAVATVVDRVREIVQAITGEG